MMSADANMNEERTDRRFILTFAGISRKSRLAVGTTAKQFSLLFCVGNETVKLKPNTWSAEGSQHKPDFVLVVVKHKDLWILTVHPESPIIDNILVITGLHHGDDGVERQETLPLNKAVRVKSGEVFRLLISVGTMSEEFSMMISEEDQSHPAAQKQYLDTLPVVVHRLIAAYLPWTTWLYTLPFVSTKLFELAKSGLPFPNLHLGEMVIPSTSDLKALSSEAVRTCRVLKVQRPWKALGAESGWYPRHPHWSATVFAQFRWRHLVALTLEVGGDDGTCTSSLRMAFRKGNFPVLEELSLGVTKGQSSWDVLLGAHLPKLTSLSIRVEPAAFLSSMAMSKGATFWAPFTTLRRLHIFIDQETFNSDWEHLFPKPTGPILPKLRSVIITGMLTRRQEILREELSIFRHSPVQTLDLDSLGADDETVDDETYGVFLVDIDASTIAFSFPRLTEICLQGGMHRLKWHSVPIAFLARLRLILCDLLFEGVQDSPDDDPRIPPYQKMKNLRMMSLFVGDECPVDAAVAKLVEILLLPKLGYLVLKGGLAINTLMAAVEKVKGTEGNRLEQINHLVLEVHQRNARQTAKVPCMLEKFRGLKWIGLSSADRIVRRGSGKTTLVNIAMLTNALLKKKHGWEVLHKTDYGVLLGGEQLPKGAIDDMRLLLQDEGTSD